ncbi:MAG: hypothetical protein WCZ65_11820 [Lysobacteraceae bacterium]
MTKLALAQAPPPARPLRWLLGAPLWGIVAGAWLLWHGEAALLSRWSPPTVALVHLFTLGVLGNAMLGSLLQFLPVAAGSAMPLGRAAAWLHGAFNLGLALFVPAMAMMRPGWLALSAVLLAVPLLSFAFAAGIALLRGGAPRALRVAIGFALGALAITVLGGVLLVAILRGEWHWPLDRLADLHALFGLLGWVLGLMAAVGSVTLPMFQGAPKVPDRWLAIWLALAGGGLLVGSAIHAISGAPAGLVLAVAPAALAFVGASLWLPRRLSHRRDSALVWFWRLGSLALLAAGVLALIEAGSAAPWSLVMAAGVLGIGIGLPLMLTGMMLEIAAFLAWIGLRSTCPRGVRIPGVSRLIPERDKLLALAMHLLAAGVLLGAAIWPVLARAAGLALLLAYAVTFACLLGGLHRARRHLPAVTGEADADRLT